jgi:hypothetical protein
MSGNCGVITQKVVSTIPYQSLDMELLPTQHLIRIRSQFAREGTAHGIQAELQRSMSEVPQADDAERYRAASKSDGYCAPELRVQRLWPCENEGNLSSAGKAVVCGGLNGCSPPQLAPLLFQAGAASLLALSDKPGRGKFSIAIECTTDIGLG